jgi:hypothetical protein
MCVNVHILCLSWYDSVATASTCVLSVEALQLQPLPDVRPDLLGRASSVASSVSMPQRISVGKYKGTDVAVCHFDQRASAAFNPTVTATATASATDAVVSTTESSHAVPRAVIERVTVLMNLPAHPQLLAVKGVLPLSDGSWGLVREHCAATTSSPPTAATLASKLALDPHWFADPQRMLKSIRDVADGLAHLHSANIVHGNCMSAPCFCVCVCQCMFVSCGGFFADFFHWFLSLSLSLARSLSLALSLSNSAQ